MSRHELRLLNGFIGFCRPSASTWPSPLAKYHYEITALERSFSVMVKGQIRNPTPELVICSTDEQHFLIVEVKSRSVNDAQAQGYANVTPAELVSQGFSIPGTNDNAGKDVVFICEEADANALELEFGRIGLEFPVVAFSDALARKHSGEFDKQELEQELSSVELDNYCWPMHFVKCDRDSSDFDLSVTLFPHVLTMLRDPGSLDVDSLCTRAIDLWDRRGSEDKKRLRSRVTELMNAMAKEELEPYIVRPGRDPVFERRTDKEWTTASFEKIAELSESFLYRKQNDLPYRKGQPPLFPYDDSLPL